MYGKIFSQMYEGTLASKGPWQALVTFQQLIVLANRHGEVDMTPEVISNRTTIPAEIIKIGIAELEKPDPDSRTPDEDGKRIIRLSDSRSWGWRIVNYGKYRKVRCEEERREYMRELMRDKRAKQKEQTIPVSSPLASVSNVSPCSMQYAVSSKDQTSRPSDGGVAAELFQFWNANRGNLPKALKLTRGRSSRIATRLKDDPDFGEAFKRAVLKARTIPFCSGSGERGWKANFDWFVGNDGNYLAVLEGKYDGNIAVIPESQTAMKLTARQRPA